MGCFVMTLCNNEINPELIDDESDFFYDEPSFEDCCADSIEDKEQQAARTHCRSEHSVNASYEGFAFKADTKDA